MELELRNEIDRRAATRCRRYCDGDKLKIVGFSEQFWTDDEIVYRVGFRARAAAWAESLDVWGDRR